jgi:CubicO group peptidase (beta-lactamase class C family)
MKSVAKLFLGVILEPVLVSMLLIAFSQVAMAQHFELSEIIAEYEASAEPLDIDAAVTVYPERRSIARATNESMRYHVASISKLFTAIVIMQLRDEGSLSLDDHLGLYLPEFGDSDIRLHQLLTHTSGLNGRDRAKRRNTQKQVDDYVKSVSRQRARKPGSRWRYADSNFNLLGRVIETITEDGFSSVLSKRLLVPIGMTDSDFDINKFELALRQTAFSKGGKPKDHPWDLAFLPSAGLQTTAKDLSKFVAAILSAYNGDGSSIISKASLAEMVVPRVDTDWDGISQAYGWQLASTSGETQWRHAGGEDGFESLLSIYPEASFGIVVLGNQEDWPRFELERDIRTRLTATTADSEPRPCSSI